MRIKSVDKNKSLQEIRNDLIERMDKQDEYLLNTMEGADLLFESGLTMYSKRESFDSIVYNAFTKSIINPNISLHPEQLKVIKEINDNPATIISAPTSFGKTFCVFEYIARFHPKNVVLVVPTLALAKEYQLNIINNNKSLFNYKVYSNIDENASYDFIENDNLFILTYEKAINNENYKKIATINFLVIDEVYKLDYLNRGDRTLVLNVAFYYLTKQAEKYCLLAPFIKGIINSNSFDKQPKMVLLDYSPVLNTVKECDIMTDKERYPKCVELLDNDLNGEKTLVYIPSPSEMAAFVNEQLKNKNDIVIESKEIQQFVEWAEEEIHPEWSLVKAIKKGYLEHHGSIPMGIRDYLLHIYNTNNNFNVLLCTSTLLEGVNTEAKNIIITKANRVSMTNINYQFSSFDFYNLVGRTGRLYKYLIGYCYYIRTPDEPIYNKANANIEVKFEITEKTEDIDIQINSARNSPEVIRYFESINLPVDTYIKKVGSPMRLTTFKKIKGNYDKNKSDLLQAINLNKRRDIVKIVGKMSYCDSSDTSKYFLIDMVLANQNRSIKSLVDNLMSQAWCKNIFNSYDELINAILKIRNGYLEHKLLTRTKVISMLLENDGVDSEVIEVLQKTINKPIENMFHLDSPQKMMLKAIGVYEVDFDKIIEFIGSDFSDLSEMKDLMIKYKNRFIDSISVVSRFEIEQFIK